MTRERNCLIRCEYSEAIGYGHLMRCLALADEMKSQGFHVSMLSSEGRPDMRDGYVDAIQQWHTASEILGSPEDADALVALAKAIGASTLVLDFYDISASYPWALRRAGLHWLQFDGFADRPLWADWVVSMSPAADMERYLLQRRDEKTRLLLGPQYAILRPDFIACRRRGGDPGNAGRVLLSFGGGDDRGMTMFCLSALMADPDWQGEVVAVVGRANPHAERIAAWIGQHGEGRVHIHIDASDMAWLMAGCDMAVISGGMTSFEAAAMGLPSMMVCLADNQRANINAWSRLGVSVNLGDAGQLSEEDFVRDFSVLAGDKGRRSEMSRRGQEIVDGRGAERVVKHMMANGG